MRTAKALTRMRNTQARLRLRCSSVLNVYINSHDLVLYELQKKNWFRDITYLRVCVILINRLKDGYRWVGWLIGHY